LNKKHIIVFLISLVLTFQIIVSTSPFIIALNPGSGVIWQGAEDAKIPKYKEIRLEGLNDEVVVIFDNWGVPHIFAKNLEDAYYAFGYIVARDRLFQMDLIRRVMAGNLSEIVGKAGLSSDIFYRSIALVKYAERSLDNIKTKYPNVYKYFEAFSKGVNYFMEHEKLPIEFQLLGYRPYKWKPLDSLLIAKAIEMGLTWDEWDLERRVLVEKFGANKTEEIFPSINYELFPILKSNETWYEGEIKPKGVSSEQIKPYKKLPRDKVSDVINLIKYMKKAIKWAKWLGEFGSNDWVVSGKFTKTGKPLLANDPHLALQVPPVWYEVHYVVEGLTNVRGVTFPGIPFVIIGHNDKVAWGFTNVGADVIDYYYYVWKDDTTYYYNGTWKKVKQWNETIKVLVGNGKYDYVTIKINETVHGPLLSRGGARYAVKWTGFLNTTEAVAIFKYNLARNITDFIEGLKLFSLPGQNVVYADVYGNIMYYPAAQYPIRKNLKTGEENVAGNLPFNGSNLDGEWIGFIPFDQIPHTINPDKGYVVTANNRPDNATLTYYWGDSENFADPYRAMRITEMIEKAIEEKGYVDINDFKRIHGDSLALDAKAFVPFLLNALNKAELNDIEKSAKQILENWDYIMDKDSAAPTIYAKWLYEYRNKVFLDEYEKYNISDVRLPKVSTLQYMTEHPENFTFWFDDKNTSEVESRDDIIIYAFKEAVNWLRNRFQSDNPSDWIYGKIHQRKLTHPLGVQLDFFNYPTVPDNGSWFTVDPASFDPSKEMWYNSGGASWREIIDLSNLSNSLCIIPGGQSGNPFSKHFDDQYWLWLRTEYKEMTFPWKPEDIPQSNIEGTFVFKPL